MFSQLQDLKKKKSTKTFRRVGMNIDVSLALEKDM